MKEPGLYEISGLAWSGYGTDRQGRSFGRRRQSWAQAALQEPVLPKALTRFRMPWRWNGGPASCRAAPPTIPDTCSRRVTKLIADARRPGRSTISTGSRAGAFRQRARSNMSTRNAAPHRRLRSRHGFGRCIARRKPQSRTTRDARGNRRLGHQHWSRRRGLPPGSGTPQQGEPSSRRNASPVMARKAPASRTISWSAGKERLARRQAAGQDRRKLLALCHDPLRLCAARDAAERIESLTNDEVYAVVAYLLSQNGMIGENDTIERRRCRRCECRTVMDLSVFPAGNEACPGGAAPF